jgi:hypothetical protein
VVFGFVLTSAMPHNVAATNPTAGVWFRLKLRLPLLLPAQKHVTPVPPKFVASPLTLLLWRA